MCVTSTSPAKDVDGNEEHEIFVPGRLCLFGEHSDWAGAMRKYNGDIACGSTIVMGINYGLYARARRLEERVLRLRSVREDGAEEKAELAMDEEVLGTLAKAGGFWSYAAGVAYIFCTEFQVEGLEVDNFKTTLPLKKGLSSSAAFCVLLARCFNICYDLKLTKRGEMQTAYEGERLTPSQCGRMDQAVAYGTVPVVLTYDGDLLRIEKARLAQILYIVLVDLHASKDTVEILAALQHAYPYPKTENGRNLVDLLGKINLNINQRAIQLMLDGDAAGLGRLMEEAQEEFDKKAGPICPKHLGLEGSPVLHKVLQYEAIQPFVYGGKGVGSQGDGTAQFICKSEEAQRRVCEILEANLSVSCLPVTVEKNM
eukprot:jgi/Picsp_1/2902/NSC_01127-R1_galactokinase